MEETHHWRKMFERNTQPQATEQTAPISARSGGALNPLGGFDDGFQPHLEASTRPKNSPPGEPPPLSPNEITDEAAMALALDTSEYRPWALQRGTRPVLMLHLRRHDPKSGLWMGWELSYPHLVAVEYTGDRLLSLDFGARLFMLEGAGLDELAGHLQIGNVLMVQEYAPGIWPAQPSGPRVSAIRKLAST